MVVAAPILVLVLVVGLGLNLLAQERSERAARIRADAVSSSAQTILVTALNAETGVRGYAASKDPDFLQPYDRALGQRSSQVQSLQAAAAAASESRQADAIVTSLDVEFSRLDTLRESVSKSSTPSAIDAELQSGKQGMDTLRAQVEILTAGELAVSASRNSSVARLEGSIEAVDVSGLILALLAGLLGILLFTSGITRRLARSVRNAERLGRGERILFQQAGGDEFDGLDRALRGAELQLAQSSREISHSRDETIEALEANRIKNDFMSRTSHELRTPLNAILGFSQLLEMSDLSETDKDSNEQILKAGRHLLALINDVLDLSRIESKEVRLSLEPVSVVSIISEVVDLMHPLAADRGIRIVQRCSAQELAAVADRQRLKQILLNFTSNAIKYNREDGEIGIECHTTDDGSVTISVSDTGHGLSTSDLTKIFSPFERLHAVQSDVEGAGIGLTVSAGLAAAMSGAITVKSKLGEGSTFILQLPRAPDIPADIATPAVASPLERAVPEAGDAKTTVLRVLYIEDNAVNVRLVEKFVSSRPATTMESARLGQQGVELAREHHPDVIFLDLHLPDLTGDEVFEQLRADPRTALIPVVMISADATPASVTRLLSRGVTAYLTKPINLAELDDLLCGLEAALVPGAA